MLHHLIVLTLSTSLTAIFLNATCPLQPLTTDNEGCPDDWSRFQGHCYKAVELNSTWLEAKNYCIQQGGHLASIWSKTENMFIRHLLTVDRNGGEPVDGIYSHAWIGLRENASSMAYWLDGSVLNYTNYANIFAIGRCYVIFACVVDEEGEAIFEHFSGKWRIWPCDHWEGKMRQAVCKKPIDLSSNGHRSAAWRTLITTGDRMEALLEGCGKCEQLQCDGTVGYGGSPDENGETALDALIMDGPQHRMGAVGNLRRVKNAARVAKAVMDYSKHSFLAGDLATQFAKEMGFPEESLTTTASEEMQLKWRDQKCQPNFRKNVQPDPRSTCGPYSPNPKTTAFDYERPNINRLNHDTIGMVVIDRNSDIAVGTSTNGASHKIPGRIGDSPIPGAGAYLDNNVGGAAETGDGDVMMSYQAVEGMRRGLSPNKACEEAISRITTFYPNFIGAVIAANKQGVHGAGCHGMETFSYAVYNSEVDHVQIATVKCI